MASPIQRARLRAGALLALAAAATIVSNPCGIGVPKRAALTSPSPASPDPADPTDPDEDPDDLGDPFGPDAPDAGADATPSPREVDDGNLVLEPGPAIVALAKKFREQQRTLTPLPAVETNDKDKPHDVQIPVAGRALFTSLKNTGVQLIEARLAEVLAHEHTLPNAKVLNRLLLEAFKSGDVDETPGGGMAFPTGIFYGVEARRWWVSGEQVSVVLTLSVPCASDDTLAVFSIEKQVIRRRMVVASTGYVSIAEGYLAMAHALGSDGSGGFHVMTIHGSPWCSSLWRGARVQVFAPTTNPGSPRLVYREQNAARLDGELAGEARGDDTGFSAEFTSYSSLAEEVVRPHAHRLERDGKGQYRRVGPWVTRTVDLADEWVSLKWPEAQRLVSTRDPAELRSIEAIHTRLSAAAGTTRGKLKLVQNAGHRTIRFECPACDKLPKRVDFVLTDAGSEPLIAAVTEVNLE